MPDSAVAVPTSRVRPPLSHDELAERISIVRELREALVRQRDQFRAYLEHLEQLEAAGPAARSIHHELKTEQAIAHEILMLQRSIEPLEVLYRAAYPRSVGEIQRLSESLARVKRHVFALIERDRTALRDEVRKLRDQVKRLKASL